MVGPNRVSIAVLIQSWPSFPIGAGLNRAGSQSRSASRARAPHGLTVTGCPAATDGLDGDPARLQQWPRREDVLVRVRAAGLRRSSCAASALGLRTAAAAVATALRRAAVAGAASSQASASCPPSARAARHRCLAHLAVALCRQTMPACIRLGHYGLVVDDQRPSIVQGCGSGGVTAA